MLPFPISEVKGTTTERAGREFYHSVHSTVESGQLLENSAVNIRKLNACWVPAGR
jgi:hypothetical protein